MLKRIGGNILLVILSVSLPILAVETFFRVAQVDTTFKAGEELQWMRGTKDFFVVDPEFGFRPILNTRRYSEYGTSKNAYTLEKEEGIERLLFIGDSVTARGKIVNALRDQFGEEKFEYWNAGVESFNTIQEFHFLEKYNLNINPDHVILSFHLNDYETTPVVFYEGDELRVYAPDTRLENSHPWLLQNSYIYRLLLDFFSRAGEEEIPDARKDIHNEVHEYLEKMKLLLASKNIRFTVVVLPYFVPYKNWTPEERERRDSTLAILEQLDIPYFDLLAEAEKAHQQGVNTQQRKGDRWHPSDEIAARFAQYLYEQKIF